MAGPGSASAQGAPDVAAEAAAATHDGPDLEASGGRTGAVEAAVVAQSGPTHSLGGDPAKEQSAVPAQYSEMPDGGACRAGACVE